MGSSDQVRNKPSQDYDQVYALKEQMAKRENDLNKSHKAEIAEMQAAHKKELEGLKASHNEQVNSIRENTKRVLTEKEQAFQTQIQRYQDAAAAQKAEKEKSGKG